MEDIIKEISPHVLKSKEPTIKHLKMKAEVTTSSDGWRRLENNSGRVYR